MVYLDPDENLLLMLSDKPLSMADTGGYTARRVSRAGDLIEKIKIFDAGLDDKAVELCKYITRQELGEDAELRFLRLEGADNDLVMAFPLNGQMQVVNIGFNVYEDARGILQRNPSVKPAEGFAEINADWIEQFFR